MAGGKINLKNIVEGGPQGTTDKNLTINSNYAYIAPFSFQDTWNEIQVGVFMSFVTGGDGNENVGVANLFREEIGGTANDEFFYFGIGKTGEPGAQALASGALSSGFIGMRGNNINFVDATTDVTNRISDLTTPNATTGNAKALLFSSSGSTYLETGMFSEHQGNWMCVGGAGDGGGGSNLGTTLGFESGDNKACTEAESNFMSYWGARFKVNNKGTSTQTINFIASQGSQAGGNLTVANTVINEGPLSDPSTGALSNFLDNINTIKFDDPDSSNSIGHTVKGIPPDSGFIYNHGGEAVPLPNALYIYNGFGTIRPRIHAWGVKVIS